jgi:hypothetical protein
MNLPPWLREVTHCCEAGVSTGDLTEDEARTLIAQWVERLA